MNGRTDQDRLLSNAMAKTITGMLVGIAAAEGAIGSIDDLAEAAAAWAADPTGREVAYCCFAARLRDWARSA